MSVQIRLQGDSTGLLQCNTDTGLDLFLCFHNHLGRKQVQGSNIVSLPVLVEETPGTAMGHALDRGQVFEIWEIFCMHCRRENSVSILTGVKTDKQAGTWGHHDLTPALVMLLPPIDPHLAHCGERLHAPRRYEIRSNVPRDIVYGDEHLGLLHSSGFARIPASQCSSDCFRYQSLCHRSLSCRRWRAQHRPAQNSATDAWTIARHLSGTSKVKRIWTWQILKDHANHLYAEHVTDK